MFSVKKCGKQECEICTEPRLAAAIFDTLYHLPHPTPDVDKYKDFSMLVCIDSLVSK